MQIYSRWGELIFETEDINEGWDGTCNGKTWSSGNYYFQIRAKGTQGQGKMIKGSVHLIR